MTARTKAQTSFLDDPVSRFGGTLAPRLRPGAPGEPEDQLRAPFEELLSAAAQHLELPLVLHGETLLRDLSTKPDYAVEVGGLLCGHVELKAPGTGADVRRFKGHNRDQWNKLKSLPNLNYHGRQRIQPVARRQADRTAPADWPAS